METFYNCQMENNSGDGKYHILGMKHRDFLTQVIYGDLKKHCFKIIEMNKKAGMTTITTNILVVDIHVNLG